MLSAILPAQQCISTAAVRQSAEYHCMQHCVAPHLRLLTSQIVLPGRMHANYAGMHQRLMQENGPFASLG